MADGLLPSQRQAVDAPRGVAVVAGAGTGKTHMLAHRYLKHVSDGLDPLAIVAVTFTERAAAELRARIRELLTTSLPAGSTAKLTVEAAQISTMHALAQRICLEFPEQAGVPADFTILDDLEGSVWLAERIDAALNELPPALFDAAPYGAVRDTVAALLDDPITAEEALGHGSDHWPALIDQTRTEALTALLAAPDWLEAAATVRSVMGPDGDKREETRRVVTGALRRLEADRALDALETLTSVNLRGGSKARYGEGEFEQLGAAIKHLRDAAKKALEVGLVDLHLGEMDERLAALLPELASAYRRIRERLESEKRERRVLDFADLEVHALRALDDQQVVAHYRSRWGAMLVDEFQDTNAVQAKILDRLAGGMLVTVVGDEKQSIYGFRGARAEVFQRYRRQVVADGGEEVQLTTSFRSHAGLVADINATFAPVLGPQHQALVATRPAGPSAAPYTTLTVIERGDIKANRQVSEAVALAERLKRLVADGVPVHDKRTGSPRPVRYGDIAVLARNWQALGVYGEVLPALGVPAVHTGGGNLLAMRDVKDGIALLRALAGPDDDVALAAVLRSPYFAVDDVTLYRLARHRAAGAAAAKSAGGGPARLSLWEALATSTDPEPTLRRARDVLTELHALRRSSAPSALLRAADSLTGHSAVLTGLPGGRRRLADFGGLLDLVRRIENGSHDLFTVWRRLRSLLRADVSIPRPRLAADGAVTLLTIHSSKGLEWPVVAVADLERRRRSQREPVLIDAELGVALRLENDDGETVEPALYRILLARDSEREALEEQRLLYVALTRARDHLILSAASERGGALDVLEPGLEAADVPRTVVPHDAGSSSLPPHHEASGSPREPVAASRLALVAGVPGRDAPAASTDDADGLESWLHAHELVGQLDDAWSALAGALHAAGVRPPAAELAGRWLRRAGAASARAPAGGDHTVDGSVRGTGLGANDGTVRYSLLAWRVAGGVVALIEDRDRPTSPIHVGPAHVTARRDGAVRSTDEAVDVWLLPVDPYAEATATAALVLAALTEFSDTRGD